MTAQAALNLVIDADYRAQRTLRAFGGDLEKVGKQGTGASKALESARKVMSTGIGAAANVAKVGIAGVGVALGAGVFAASKFVAAGADVQEAMGKFNVVFADAEGTVGKVTSELDAFAKASGRNKFALREMAGGLGDILKPLGFNVAEAGDLSVTLSKLAVDLGSFNNMAPEEAFERIRGTLIGSHENALQFGVVINENTLKAELARMGADEFTGAMLEQAKVQARINLLIAGTSDAQGDAIRTSGSWTNQMLRLRSILEETSAELGLKLIPALSPFLEMLGDLAAKWAPKAAEALENLIGKMDVEALKASLDTFIAGLTVGEVNLGSFSFDFKSKELSFGDFYSHKWSDETGEIMINIGGVQIDKESGHPKISYGDVFSIELTDEDQLLINGISLGDWAGIGLASLFGADTEFDDTGALLINGLSLGDWTALGIDSILSTDVKFDDTGALLINGVSLGDWAKWGLSTLFSDTITFDDDGALLINGVSLGDWTGFGFSALFGEDITFDENGALLVNGFGLGDWVGFGLSDLFGETITFNDDGAILVNGLSLGDWVGLSWTDILNIPVNDEGQITLAIGDVVFVKEGEGTLATSIIMSLLGGGIFALTQGGKLVMNIRPKLSFGDGAGDGDSETGIGGTIGSAIASKIMAAATGMSLKIQATISDAGGLLASALSLTFNDVTDYFSTWGWPEYITWEWPAYLTFKWPTYPSWKWPEIKTPEWVDRLLSVFGGGGDAEPEETTDTPGDPPNARGTSYWTGGSTWVGEEGPELVDLPRGSRIYPAGVSASMARSGSSRSVTINVSATINSKIDQYELAYTLAEVLQRA